MARYVVHVRSSKSPAEAFAYMADLTNFAKWDPGVLKVTQVKGSGAGPDSEFDVSVKSIGGSTTLRYRIISFDSPGSVVAQARNRFLSSLDTITVRADGDGSIVTYDAALTLNGPLGLADPLLAPAFKKIGDSAAAGLVKALDGTRID